VVSGAEPTSRRTRVVVVAVVLVALLGLALDRQAAGGERDQLAGAVAAGEQSVAEAESSLIGLRQYLAPSAERPDLPAAERARAYAPLGRDAERWVQRVDARLADVRAVRVLPWHDDTRQVRDAAVAELQEAVERLTAVARAPGG
jgi:hypothetical protein